MANQYAVIDSSTGFILETVDSYEAALEYKKTLPEDTKVLIQTVLFEYGHPIKEQAEGVEDTLLRG